MPFTMEVVFAFFALFGKTRMDFIRIDMTSCLAS